MQPVKFKNYDDSKIYGEMINRLKYLKQNYPEYFEEKEKNKELEEYVNWHIEHLTEDIADYIDDDRKANANLIEELKEEREHWKDIIRILNNEKTYIDYKKEINRYE